MYLTLKTSWLFGCPEQLERAYATIVYLLQQMKALSDSTMKKDLC